jgi:transposase
MSAFVGIDVSKATLDVAIRQDAQSQHFQVPNTLTGFQSLYQRLQASGAISVIALEATGRYGEAVAHFLLEQGYPLNYLNPKLTHRFSQKSLRYSKTDAHDAQSIAHYAQLHPSPSWIAPSLEQRQLQQRSRRLEALKKMRQQDINRLKSGLDDPFVLEQIQALIAHFDALIRATESSLQDLIRQNPTLMSHFKLLTSIKGIGKITATLLLAELGDMQRFASVKQLTAFVGLDVLDFQSGSSVKRPAHISKQGNPRLRAALYMPALTAIRYNPACSRLYQRLEAKHKPPKVRIVAVMKKLLHQVYGVLKSQRPFDPHFQPFSELAA